MNSLRMQQRVLFSLSMCISLLLFLVACQSVTNAQPSVTHTAVPVRSPVATTAGNVVVPPTQTPTGSTSSEELPSALLPIPIATPVNKNRPVLAFYYSWYEPKTWCTCQMSDLPTSQYTSRDSGTINRQLVEAANAGITGFISSWWGPGDATDSNFVKLLSASKQLEQATNYHFASSIYFESDAPALSSTAQMEAALRYVQEHYANDPHFFHWQGKPVIFFWDPLGKQRTLAQWAEIRQQVDPQHQMIWSAESDDPNVLTVFDGIHLFSAAYWGIQQNNIEQVDQGFRDKINAYNQANHTQKIWAAGVLPGYDDTRVPGRKGTYSIKRNNGSTYQSSWAGAMASSPDWITITSFNEWFEGSMIEPGQGYEEQYLTLTRQFAKQWHG